MNSLAEENFDSWLNDSWGLSVIIILAPSTHIYSAIKVQAYPCNSRVYPFGNLFPQHKLQGWARGQRQRGCSEPQGRVPEEPPRAAADTAEAAWLHILSGRGAVPGEMLLYKKLRGQLGGFLSLPLHA